MLSNKPYLIRALYQWIIDSECTPYLLIDVDMPRVDVPREFAEGGQIVLNIAPTAVKALEVTNKEITFSARFSGIKKEIYVPVNAVLAIYAMENEQGMFFEAEEVPDEKESGSSGDGDSGGQKSKKKSHLHIVE